MLQQAGSTEAVSKAPSLIPLWYVIVHKHASLSMYASLQDACEEAAYDPGATSEEVQVHGAAAPVHQAVLSSGFPPRAPSVQHVWRCS